MAGIPVDNPQITVEIGKMLGCEEVARHSRTISSKVLPLKNEVTATINTEEIVVLEKVK